VTRRDAARLLGRSTSTIDSWIRAGLLRAVRLDGQGARGRPVHLYRLRDVFDADRTVRRRGLTLSRRRATASG
jgi:transposase